MNTPHNSDNNLNPNSIVSSYYNQRANYNQVEREDSPIFYLRNYNNWVKAIMIQSYCRQGYSVLDYAGGKGGDLHKWVKARIGHLVLIDIAEESVKQAIIRYNNLYKHKSFSQADNDKTPPFSAIFICADCCKEG
jgi:mRNA (guanine-N7-)-methyltransferase